MTSGFLLANECPLASKCIVANEYQNNSTVTSLKDAKQLKVNKNVSMNATNQSFQKSVGKKIHFPSVKQDIEEDDEHPEIKEYKSKLVKLFKGVSLPIG